MKGAKQSLDDSLAITDAISMIAEKHAYLSETLSIGEGIDFIGGLQIEARNALTGALIPGAVYTVSPNPSGGNTLTISDGPATTPYGDHDGINNGRVVINNLHFISYNVTMVTIPSGFNVLGNSTVYTLHYTNFNGTAVFRLTPTATILSNMTNVIITEHSTQHPTLFHYLLNYL